LSTVSSSTSNVHYIFENEIKIIKGVPLIEISKLKLHPNNIKSHSEDQINNLCKLMKIVGFKDPIVIDKKFEVKAGHGRLLAAQQLGMYKVPYILLEGLTKKQMDLFMYMDNYINESPWIEDNVQLLLEDMPTTLLDNFEVNWDDVMTIEPTEETDEIPEPPENPKSKLGEIYQLGNHRIMCGDSTDSKNIGLLMDTKKAQAVITDPPYGLGGYAGRSGKFEKMKGDNEDVTKFYAAIDRTIPEIYMWCSWSYLQKSKETPRDIIVWKKNNFGMGRGYRGQYEICLYFGKFSGSDSDVWEIAKDNVSGYKHPTQKPVALGVRAIKNSTKRGEIIIDYYLGSGSTLIACEQTNRICYGMELDPAYIDVIITRWENYTNNKVKLIKKED